MKLVKTKSLLGMTAPILLLAACSGGGADSTSNANEEPGIGQANEVVPETTAVAGRVADGYLQGATVCVDLNENGSCDANEPQAISGAGGSYTLDVPDDAADKPILAIVPATAIDEDTGEAIGKELHFSTPGDKPSFVSPITTLVHQELKNNPSLKTEDAEASVLETLGMPDEEGASLFTDYVEQSESGDEELREKFHYLHQTARVVATMMGDIQENVEAAATENGIDVDSDLDTQAAIRQLVQDELRSLLPEISAAVAEQISEQQSDTSGSSEGESEVFTIDPDAIAEGIEVEDVSADIVDEIDAIKAENPVQQASMQDILKRGFYLLDIDCHYEDEYGPEDGIEEDYEETGAVVLHDDGSPGIVDLPEFCEADYSLISVSGEDNEMQEERYYYDAETATWMKDESDDYDDAEIPHIYVLSNGEWVAGDDDGPTGPVEFTEDGGAVLTSESGKMRVYAIERKLDNTSVLRHLKGRGADHSIANMVSEGALFDEGSSEYKLSIKRDERLTVLFNWYPEEEDKEQCALFDGNCNVVGERTDDGFIHYTSLHELQERSLEGVIINEIAHDHHSNYAVDAKISGSADAAGNMPESGEVSWVLSKPSWDNNHDDSNTEHCKQPEEYDSTKAPIHETEIDELSNREITDEQDSTEPQCAYNEFEHHPDGEKYPDGEQHPNGEKYPDGEQYPVNAVEDDAFVDTDESQPSTTDEDSGKVIATGSWKHIVEDGVSMIEIEIPVAVRHRMDEDEISSMLLIEHTGFVRRGARFSAQSVDDEVAYSEPTFTTLKPIIEKYVSQ